MSSTPGESVANL
jgi:hypothetical protein